MTDGYISDRELKCSDCYIRNSCDLHPSTCNKRLSVFDEEGLKIHDAKVRADAIDDAINEVTKRMSDYLEFDDLKIDWDLFCDEMKEIAEQLKEQTND